MAPYFRRTVFLLAVLVPFVSTFAYAQNVCNQQHFQPRPISLGVSGGNINAIGGGFCCVGTLGALVKNPSGTKQYILSNSHVLSRINQGASGEQITQPGLADEACAQNPGDTVATLTKAVPISFNQGALNLVDAAIAETAPGDVGDQILNIGGISGRVIGTPRAALGLSVQKMGDETCLTTGTVAAINVTIAVQYPPICNGSSGTATFRRQIEITPGSFISAGDSGSLVVTSETCPRAVGLIFAGSGTAAFANPIGPVLSKLRVRMVAGCNAKSAMAANTTETRNGSDTSSAPGIAARPAAAVVDHATAVQEHYHGDMMKVPGVVGTGVGIGAQPGTVAIEVYVKKDTPETRAAIPSQVGGIPVRVVVTGPIVAY